MTLSLHASFVLLALAAAAPPARAAPQPPQPNDQQIMIIITTGAGNGANGVAMMRLSFPSAEACAAAAKIMQQETRGGFVTARCLATH
jgi:hypothetical protein